MTSILLLHLVIGVGLMIAARHIGRGSLMIAAVPPFVALIWLVSNTARVLDGFVVEQSWRWVDELGIAVDLRLDGFSLLMGLVVAGIGVLVFVYSWSYFGAAYEGVARLAGLLSLFCGSMLGLVFADNLVLLYGFWELTSVTSFLLIGNQFRQPEARAAATQAILVTGAGGLAMLMGFIVLGESAGTYRLHELLDDPPSGGLVSVALVLVLAGAFTKSAQYPFHGWLPAAMVSPTPVSAYLHSATMVKAGVYLVARLGPAFATAVVWRPLVLCVGVATMVCGALRALRQWDLKLLLAYGTISQLGFMMVLFGIGLEEATLAGCAVLLSHALFKATLFMVVGMVDHGAGTRDVRDLGALGVGWGPVRVVSVVAVASMAGVPLAVGFIAKELGLEALVHGGFVGSWIVLVVIVGASALTAAYGVRFVAGLFGRFAHESSRGVELVEVPAAPGVGRVHAPDVVFFTPAALLALLTVIWGVAPAILDRLMSAASGSLVTGTQSAHLALWHGVNLPLVLSGAALGAGALLYWQHARVDRVLAVGNGLPSGDDLYQKAIAGLNRTAARVTGVVQSGSMPVYLGVILTTVAVVPGAVMLGAGRLPRLPEVVESWAHVPIALLLVVSALGAATVRHRLSAALLLGVTGYAMAALFVTLGAPDLALTQAAIETLTTVLFVLVLRRLPSQFPRRSKATVRFARIAISAAVGLMVFMVALFAAGEQLPLSVSPTMIDLALPEANGRNVVNVILVDFRGLDTLGEITVVAVAAVGAVALARAGRTPRSDPSTSVTGPAGTSRHVFVDIAVRALVDVALVVSLYLLVIGHNQTGGGFVGGLVAGAALALRYIAGGLDDVRRMVRPKPWTILGGGVLLAGLTAVVPVLFGRPLLENGYWDPVLPLVGKVGVSSAFFFDAGVYFAVVGLVFMVFEAFGSDRTEVIS